MAALGGCRYCKVGKVVIVQVSGPQANGNTTFCTLPEAFRPPSYFASPAYDYGCGGYIEANNITGDVCYIGTRVGAVWGTLVYPCA